MPKPEGYRSLGMAKPEQHAMAASMLVHADEAKVEHRKLPCAGIAGWLVKWSMCVEEGKWGTGPFNSLAGAATL